MLRTMAILIAMLNVTLAAATAVLVLLARERLHVGSVGYGSLFTCMAAGTVLGSVVGDRVIRRVTATWTIRIGLVVEAGTHLTLALATNVYVVGAVLAAFGGSRGVVDHRGKLAAAAADPGAHDRPGQQRDLVHLLRRQLHRGAARRRSRTCARHHRTILGRFVVAVIVVAATWRVFDRTTVAAAYAEPVAAETGRA
jgi:Transmembrane secretion effector